MNDAQEKPIMTGNDASNALLDSTRTEAIMRLMDRGEDRETIEREIAALETDLYQANRELAEAKRDRDEWKEATAQANAAIEHYQAERDKAERALSEAKSDADTLRWIQESARTNPDHAVLVALEPDGKTWRYTHGRPR